MKAARLALQTAQDISIETSSANLLRVTSTAPNGVKKLRELVLELGFRGKLVSQDAKDTPVSELLRSFEIDKERKENLLPTLEEADKPFALPKGWKWAFFPAVANYKVGKTPPTKSSVYWSEKEIPWVSISDMPHYGLISQTERHVSAAASKEVFKYPPIPAGTLLMSFKLTVGKVSILATDAYHNEAIISIVPDNIVDKNFLFRFLPLIAQSGKTKNAIKGNTLNSESIAALIVPVPPLAEQKRIVAKVDELMTLCDRLEAQETDAAAAHETLVKALLGTLTQSKTTKEFQENWQRIAQNFDILFTTETSIDTLKQTILQLAVMGKLSSPLKTDTPIKMLLAKILEEKKRTGMTDKEARLFQEEMQHALAEHVGENRIVLKARTFCHFITKGTTPASNELLDAGEIPFLKVYNIVNNQLDFAYKPSFISKEVHEGKLRRSELIPGDVIMNIVGPPLGKVAIISAEYARWNMNQALAVFRPLAGILNSYLYRMLTCNLVLSSVLKEVKGTAGQDNLSLEQCRDLLIPIPSVEEQHRIVEKVDELMSMSDELKGRLTKSHTLHEHLAAALVEKAVS